MSDGDRVTFFTRHLPNLIQLGSDGGLGVFIIQKNAAGQDGESDLSAHGGDGRFRRCVAIQKEEIASLEFRQDDRHQLPIRGAARPHVIIGPHMVRDGVQIPGKHLQNILWAHRVDDKAAAGDLVVNRIQGKMEDDLGMSP